VKKIQANEEITMARRNANEVPHCAGAKTAVAASNMVEMVGEQRERDDARHKWNGAKKVMQSWSECDVFCCHNAFETFVASLLIFDCSM
jgi:hypothetical protein